MEEKKAAAKGRCKRYHLDPLLSPAPAHPGSPLGSAFAHRQLPGRDHLLPLTGFTQARFLYASSDHSGRHRIPAQGAPSQSAVPSDAQDISCAPLGAFRSSSHFIKRPELDTRFRNIPISSSTETTACPSQCCNHQNDPYTF